MEHRSATFLIDNINYVLTGINFCILICSLFLVTLYNSAIHAARTVVRSDGNNETIITKQKDSD